MEYRTYEYLEDPKKRGRRSVGSRRAHGEGNWWRALLTRAAEDPSVVLEDPRCHVPELCDDFFDLCDGLSLVAPWKAPSYARTAVELARLVGDRHRVHQSLGVLLHALTASRHNAETWALVEEYGTKASRCCARCESEFYYRYGDVLVEKKRPEAALAALRKSLALRAKGVDDDWYGRLLTLVAIACFYLRDFKQAISIAGEALARLDLASPRGYFIDTVAHMVVFLPPTDGRYDKTALRLLKQFKRRLVGYGDDLADVRGHLLWAEGILYARLGKRLTAMKRLESARQSLLKHGLAREAAAVTIDHALAYKPRGDEVNVRAVRPLVVKCLRQRNDLDEELAVRLEAFLSMLEEEPERALPELLALRASFYAPVPGRLGEARYPELARRAAEAEAARRLVLRRLPRVRIEVVAPGIELDRRFQRQLKTSSALHPPYSSDANVSNNNNISAASSKSNAGSDANAGSREPASTLRKTGITALRSSGSSSLS